MVLCMIVYAVYWIITGTFLYSVGTVRWDSKLPFGRMTWEDKTRYYFYLHFFGGLWNIAFCLSASYFIISCATIIWYFGGHNSDIPNPIGRATKWLFRYHLGSVAFGSILLAIVWAIRIIGQYIHDKIKESQPQNQTVQCLAKCMLCCINCFERFIRFFNKHAYAEVALRSSNFCTSARRGMQVVGLNFIRFGVLHGLGEVVMFFATIFITCSTTIACYFILKSYQTTVSSGMSSTAGPLLVVFLISWVVTDLFGHIWEVSSDAILHSYCIDHEVHKNLGMNPQHVSSKLQRALDSAKENKDRKKKTGLNQDIIG
jgi:hypothetical protein